MNTGAFSVRRVFPLLLALCFCLVAFLPLEARGQVDLRGKKGVVDPKDLKKYDPPPQSLKIKEPPPPQPRKAPGGDAAPKNPPSDQGGDLSKRRAPVRGQPHPDWKPPAPPMAPKPGLVR